jgi:CheY-like chemotaxis protein
MTKAITLKINSIVLADDDSDDHLLFKDVIQQVSPAFQLTMVSDGLKLANLLKHYLPDLLFLDLDMPGKSGLECLVEIRANPGLKGLPVIVFSATSRPANIATAYEMGADLFLVKPSTYADLVAAMKGILLLDWSNPAQIKEQYLVKDQYTAYA